MGKYFKFTDDQTRKVQDFLRAYFQGLQPDANKRHHKPTWDTLSSEIEKKYPELRISKRTFKRNFGSFVNSLKEETGLPVLSKRLSKDYIAHAKEIFLKVLSSLPTERFDTILFDDLFELADEHSPTLQLAEKKKPTLLHYFSLQELKDEARLLRPRQSTEHLHEAHEQAPASLENDLNPANGVPYIAAQGSEPRAAGAGRGHADKERRQVERRQARRDPFEYPEDDEDDVYSQGLGGMRQDASAPGEQPPPLVPDATCNDELRHARDGANCDGRDGASTEAGAVERQCEGSAAVAVPVHRATGEVATSASRDPDQAEGPGGNCIPSGIGSQQGEMICDSGDPTAFAPRIQGVKFFVTSFLKIGSHLFPLKHFSEWSQPAYLVDAADTGEEKLAVADAEAILGKAVQDALQKQISTKPTAITGPIASRRAQDHYARSQHDRRLAPAPPRASKALLTLRDLVLDTEREGYDHVIHLQKQIPNFQSFAKLSDLFAHHSPRVELDSGLGHGGFGTVLSCTVISTDDNRQRAALKFEVTGCTRISCLQYEALVYQTMSGRNGKEDPDKPVPSFVRGLSYNMAHFFMKIPLSDSQVVRILCLELVDLEPQKILKNAHSVFKSESRIEASFRDILLKLLYSFLYMIQNGVIHLDLKLPHLAYRQGMRQLLFLDWGLAELKDRTYEDVDKMENAPKRAKLESNPTFGLQKVENVLPRFACDRPGTCGSRPPFTLDGTFEGSCRASIWQAAVILLELFLPVPNAKAEAKEYEKALYKAVEAGTLEVFMSFALRGGTCPDDSCRQCLELVHNLFRDALSKKDPLITITRALLSEFSLCYIAETVELERQLNHDGVVVDGETYEDGTIQRPLLLLKHRKYGLLSIILFDSQHGDMASPYCGRVVNAPGSHVSSVSFCMHGLPLGTGEVLNGQPCDDLPLMHIINSRKVGSLFMSSRRDPTKDTPGNVALPDRLKSKALKEDPTYGADVKYIEMKYRRNSRYGQPNSWSYQWGHGCGSIGLPQDAISACMRPKGLIDDLDLLDQKTLEIVMKHRLRLIQEGRWADADWGQCTCDRRSLECSVTCRFLQGFDNIIPYQPKLKPDNGNVWGPPGEAEPRVIAGLTVSANGYNPESLIARMERFGACLVSCVGEIFPILFAEAEIYARAECRKICTNSVFIYPPKANGAPDVGHGLKKLGYLNGKCPISKCLLQFLEFIRPGFKPLQATGSNGKPVEQLELIWQLSPLKGHVGEVQVQHVDATLRGLPGGNVKNGGFLPSNLQAVLDGRGPLSVFVSFDDDYYVIVYLTGHKLAIECMKHFSRHFDRAQDLYFQKHPDSNIEDFQAVWCGGTVQYLQELCPDVRLDPVRIPVRKGALLAISSFLPHSGPSVEGVRAFTLAGPEDGDFVALNDTTEDLPTSVCLGALMSFLKPLAERSERIS